jgi:hypothetical protein
VVVLAGAVVAVAVAVVEAVGVAVGSFFFRSITYRYVMTASVTASMRVKILKVIIPAFEPFEPFEDIVFLFVVCCAKIFFIEEGECH